MSKSSYIFSYATIKENQLQYLTHKIRAINEREAWRRFRFWSSNQSIIAADIVSSSDLRWREEHLGITILKDE